MFKLSLTYILLLLVFHTTIAQESINFLSIDKNTYELYQKKDWKGLIPLAKSGIKKNIDYFYLRMRLGIAYYEQDKYRQAIPHFQKALDFNSNDLFAQEYLYFSYLFSGRKSDAGNLISKFPKSLINKLKIETKQGISGLSVFNSYTWNMDPVSADSYSPGVDASLDGWQNITKNFNLFNFNIEHQISNRLTFYYGYGFLSKSKFHYSQYANEAFLYPNDKFSQHQFYFSGSSLIGQGLSINYTLHYINLRPNIYYTQSGFGGGPSSTLSYVNPMNNWAGYFSVNKESGLFNLGAGLAYSNLNEQNQFQKDLILAFYPLGNLNLYTVSKISHQSEFYQNKQIRQHFIFDQVVGIKLFNPLWIEMNGTFGDITNYTDKGGLVIYNEMNRIKSRMAMNLIVPIIDKGLEFYVRYEYQENESYFNSTTSTTLDFFNPINYSMQNLTGGIKWNF